jgi:outer membrane immunogenic protein
MINRIGRWAAAVATGVFAISASALAADMPVKAPPPVVVVQSWTGFYVGAHGGYAWGRNSVGYSANDPASAGLFASVGPLGTAGMNASNRFTTRGALGGLQVGYNRQIGPRWVVGVEADISLSSIRGSETRTGAAVGFPISFTAEERVRSFGTVRGRFGVLPTENLLAFVTGGLAYGRVQRSAALNTNFAAGGFTAAAGGFSLLCDTTNPQCFVGSTTGWQAGWTAGAGIEHKWTSNLSFKAELLHVSLRSSPVTATATKLQLAGFGAPSTYNANFGRTNFNVARAGVNWHFPPAN